MEFPAKQLLMLLDLVRGNREWGPEVFDAAMDIVKYVYHTFINKEPVPIGDMNDFDPETAIMECLNIKSIGVSPAIWISLGMWILQKVIERMVK